MKMVNWFSCYLHNLEMLIIGFSICSWECKKFHACNFYVILIAIVRNTIYYSNLKKVILGKCMNLSVFFNGSRNEKSLLSDMPLEMNSGLRVAAQSVIVITLSR